MAGETDPFRRLETVSHIAIAVSGGSDSLALMGLVRDWSLSLAVRPRITVLTVDHALRRESAAEAVQVGRLANAIGLDHHILVWTGAKPQTALQARARQARYDLMTEWCRSNAAGLLLTGHTMDDQAETVAMRMQRTRTDASLAGIWRERDCNGIILYRPLLEMRREALRHYLVGRGQDWLDDPSNEQMRFERVRVRHTLMASENDLVPALAAQAVAAARQVEVDRLLANDFGEAHLQWHPEGYGSVERKAFSRLEAAAQQMVMAAQIDTLTGNRVEPGKLTSLATWVATGGAARRSLGGVLFALRKSCVLAAREPGRIPALACHVPDSGRLLWDHRIWVESLPGTHVRRACLQEVPLAPSGPMPRFVRDGWPVAVDGEGRPVAAVAAFKPCLR